MRSPFVAILGAAALLSVQGCLVGNGGFHEFEQMRAKFLAQTQPSDTTAVIVYDPSDCLSCGSPLGLWLSWQKIPHHFLHIVLTRPPTGSERTQLLATRATFEGPLSGISKALATPRIYMIHNGHIADSAIGYGRQHSVLARYSKKGS